MKKIIYTLLISLLFPLGALASTPSDLTQTVRTAIADIQAISKDSSLNKAQSRQKMDLIVDPIFDFGLMGKLSLGKVNWKRFTTPERKEFVKLFSLRTKASYLDKIDLYKDETITVSEGTMVKKRIHVSSYIMKEGEKKEILYKFYKTKKGIWKVYDVDVLGVSLIQTNRSQFEAILKNSSPSKLLEKLRSTND